MNEEHSIQFRREARTVKNGRVRWAGFTYRLPAVICEDRYSDRLIMAECLEGSRVEVSGDQAYSEVGCYLHVARGWYGDLFVGGAGVDRFLTPECVTPRKKKP